MSMDYPLYEELCRRKHPAAWWWLVGDRLYYLGLIPGMLSLAAVPWSAAGALFGVFTWAFVRAWLVLLAVAVPTFLLGSILKRHAHKAAERDGIREQ